MKVKTRKAILVVPPDGKGIRAVRIPYWILFLFCLVICLGFAGYFIPFNNFTLDVVEQNQKNYLDNQNKRLLAAIRPMHRFIDNLNDEIELLENQKRKISKLLGGDDQATAAGSPKSSRASFLSLDDLVAVTMKNYTLFSGVMKSNAKSSPTAYFDHVPLIRPVLDKPLVATRFGREKDPFTGYVKMHYGIDFIEPRGAPVIATAAGVISRIEDGKMWGRRVFINHAFGFSSVYAHLGTVEAFVGKKVKKGDKIGTAGLSGLTTGVHVHYEIWHNGKPENPEEFFYPDEE